MRSQTTLGRRTTYSFCMLVEKTGKVSEGQLNGCEGVEGQRGEEEALGRPGSYILVTFRDTSSLKVRFELILIAHNFFVSHYNIYRRVHFCNPRLRT